MGVVRRQGDWRLEKREEGVYEITFRRETQVKVLTSDVAASYRGFSRFDAVPVREVSSYSEAEGLFEEKAHGPPPLGMAPSASDGRTGSRGGDQDVDLRDLPPYGFGLVFLGVGGFASYIFWGATNPYYVLFGVVCIVVGLIPFAYAGYVLRIDDWLSAWEFLVTAEEYGETSSGSSESPEKTPPAPKKLKEQLFFDRASQKCEWCEESYDHLQVHHIVPRREGGPNQPDNLIVLCPNCHENADREAIARSKLKSKVNRLPEISAD
jgi:5-methylcytosine-specific restriction endonuclease McrA